MGSAVKRGDWLDLGYWMSAAGAVMFAYSALQLGLMIGFDGMGWL